MTDKQQVTKNIDLSAELMQYMIGNKVKAKPNYSYVVFSQDDKKLNEMNETLIKELVQEGRRVMRAIKLSGKKDRWTFAVVS